MAIKSGKSTGVVRLSSASTDFTISNAGSDESQEFYSLVLHNQDASQTNIVELFVSDDATSATTERVDKLTLTGDETKRCKPLALAAGQYLIGKSDADDVIAIGIYTSRTGADR